MSPPLWAGNSETSILETEDRPGRSQGPDRAAFPGPSGIAALVELCSVRGAGDGQQERGSTLVCRGGGRQNTDRQCSAELARRPCIN